MKTFPEVNRELRGHDFYTGLSELPPLYATEDIPAEEKMVLAHYFNSSSDWFIVELDPELLEGFGYAVVGGYEQGGEWGYTDLPALESAKRGELGSLVERDLHWRPKPWAQAMKERGYSI